MAKSKSVIYGVTKQQLLDGVEIGTLTMGSTAVAFPRLSARVAGVAPDEGANLDSTRALGFWLTAYGALLQYVETEAERERLLMAGAALGAAYCVNVLNGASRHRISWRGAFTHVAIVGSMVAAACLYLTD